MSFLDKLKIKTEQDQESNVADNYPEKDKKMTGFLQLDVDIYQAVDAIIVVAPIPGVEIKDLNITVENENDVITIQGKRETPLLIEAGQNEDSKYLRQECKWGNFYRQIILPQEINVNEIEAKFRKGILFLRLPLLRLQTKGRKKIAIESENK